MNGRHLIYILILLLDWTSALAQPRLDKEEFYLGVQGGVMGSMVAFSPQVKQSVLPPHWGPTAGLVFRYIGHKVCGWQMELNYQDRGWREQDTDYERQQHYVELSMLSHFYFGRRARGYVNLGPQIGYCVAESWKGLPEGVSIEPGMSSVLLHQYAPIEKPFDWGVAAGLGFYYRTKKAGTYQLDARFSYALGSMFANSQMDYFSMSNAMNLSVTLAYLWEFKKR